jgi:hypothetical protein
MVEQVIAKCGDIYQGLFAGKCGEKSDLLILFQDNRNLLCVAF